MGKTRAKGWLAASAVASALAGFSLFQFIPRSPDEMSRVLPDPLFAPGAIPGYDACSSSCGDVLLAELQKATVARPQLRFMRYRTVDNSTEEVTTIRNKGWVVRDYAPFRVEPPVDWAADPHSDRNWRFQLNALYPAMPFLQHFDETGDRDSLLFAKSLALDWIDYNLIRELENDFKWYDMAVGIRAANLAYLLDRLLRLDALNASELRLFLDAAVEHIRHLRNPEELARTNHAYFQLAGVAGLCTLLPELRDCIDGQRYAARELEKLLEAQFSADGIHREHSPGYHGFAVETVDIITSTGWLEVSAEAARRIELAKNNLWWLVRPDGYFAQVGDTSGPPTEYQASLLREQPASHVSFSEGEYGVVRAPSAGSKLDGYLFLTAAHHSRTHKHYDSLSFVVFDRDRPILVDSGKYAYEDDDKRAYVRSTRAHNTVEIDKADVDRGPPAPPELLQTAQLGDVFVVVAKRRREENATTHTRYLAYEPGRWLLVYDELRSSMPHSFTQWFHFPADATVEDGDHAFAVTVPGLSDPVQVVDLSGDAKLTNLRGQQEPRLQGWLSPKYRSLVPSPVIGFSKQAQSAAFATLFSFEPIQGKPSLVEGKDGHVSLCWRAGARAVGAGVTVVGQNVKLSACEN